MLDEIVSWNTGIWKLEDILIILLNYSSSCSSINLLFMNSFILSIKKTLKKTQILTSNSICGWAGSFKFQIFTLWSKAIEIKMSLANGCHLTNWTLFPWADKVKWGSLTNKRRRKKLVKLISFLHKPVISVKQEVQQLTSC